MMMTQSAGVKQQIITVHVHSNKYNTCTNNTDDWDTDKAAMCVCQGTSTKYSSSVVLLTKLKMKSFKSSKKIF